MNHEIRNAAASDIAAVIHIENACFPAGIRENAETFLGRMAAFPEGFTLLGSEPVGYLSSELWDRVPPPERRFWALGHSAEREHKRDGTVLYISSFAILPSARGGTGRFFFNASIHLILKSCPRIERIAFIVNETWLPARHIYETEGYAQTGSIPDFFTPAGKDEPQTAALIMEKKV
jgi:ribosomal-protein-alanine N-acetyltransferase